MKTKATNSDESRRDGLSPQQARAVDLIAAGTNLTDAAASLGMSRQTLSEWSNHSCAFQAALNARRIEVWDSTADRLRSLTTKAIDRIEREIDAPGPTGVRSAELILRAVGLLDMGRPTGETAADKIESDRENRELWGEILGSLRA